MFRFLTNKLDGEGAPEVGKGTSDKDSILEALGEIDKRMARTEGNVRKLAEHSQKSYTPPAPVGKENQGPWIKITRKPNATKKVRQPAKTVQATNSSAEAND